MTSKGLVTFRGLYRCPNIYEFFSSLGLHWFSDLMHNATNTLILTISLSSSLRLIFLFQASFLRKFFSRMLNVHSLDSPNILVIMSFFLNLSL